MEPENHRKKDTSDDECLEHTHPIPAGELSRYSVDGDPHSEMDIASYVKGQAPDEKVEHVERIKREIVLGDVIKWGRC
jgi:hypothetical protein